MALGVVLEVFVGQDGERVALGLLALRSPVPARARIPNLVADVLAGLHQRQVRVGAERAAPEFPLRERADRLLEWLRGSETFAAVWESARDEIVQAWVKAHPGIQPFTWWSADAPKWRLEDMPKRIAIPYLPFGLPSAFVDSWAVEYYNGRRRDVHGERIGTEYHEGHFSGLAIDPTDPPRYESQAAYLQRHGLLEEAERRRLPADAFEPEIIQLNAAP
jgi:hypothetical protein